MIDEWAQDIHQGDAAETLARMPESSVHMAMCSPPYFGLRDYGVDGQIGLEESLDDYIASIVDVADELRRVLRPDGSWWLNLGDTYSGGGGIAGKPDDWEDMHDDSNYPDEPPARSTSLGAKNKMLVPHRVAIALQDAGWIVRSDAVCAKTNGMPDPVKDRLREDKEFLFHLTPEPEYWFDLDAIREEHAEASIKRSGRHDHAERGHPTSEQTLDPDKFVHPNGANPGDILELPVGNFPDAHFAVYPSGLCEDPIKASCPPKVCAGCGTPYRRVVDNTPLHKRDLAEIKRSQAQRAVEQFRISALGDEHVQAMRAVGFGDGDHGHALQGSKDRVSDRQRRLAEEAKDVLGGYFREFVASPDRRSAGWRQDCDCDVEDTKPGIVLDPFAGAGTTCLVAKRLGRRFVGIDLNPEYVAMAQKRVGVTVDQPDLLLEDGETPLTAYADGGGD